MNTPDWIAIIVVLGILAACLIFDIWVRRANDPRLPVSNGRAMTDDSHLWIHIATLVWLIALTIAVVRLT